MDICQNQDAVPLWRSKNIEKWSENVNASGWRYPRANMTRGLLYYCRYFVLEVKSRLART